ncbi:MAG TPA: hydantoinase B/oxoprolinase family protein [Rhodopila sp.]|uniref:hydantoinase B/oxoprolinase family protein n=1 Tax=Rhodopila sp. TaxID=2480087 RepID=UPI002C8C617C|nr:hydantoinase B/oxoprolinase family protein [Rhodopila sp.]HVY16733.1 hydantoinase B/oxoprolinase family protein [Rhodopila sp.]
MAHSFTSIDRDVFQAQLVGIAEEMSRALRRSAYSPIIWDMYDYSCAIFTPAGEMLAQSETIPAQLGTMSTALEGVRRAIPLDRWKMGDILICNDPYRGCAHTSDFTLFSPVFDGDTIVAITSTIAHHIDVGGRSPGTTALDNTEIFAEGLVIPPVRLVDGGKTSDVVMEFIRSNVRYPDATLGDLQAQMAGCLTAERRLGEVVARYGCRGFADLAEAMLDYGDRYTKVMISQFPDGEYAAETLIEDEIASPDLVRLSVRLAIAGSRLHIDFAGTSEQRPFGLNCPWASTVSMARYAAKCMISPDTPQNGGFDRSVSITAPAGSVLNPVTPAAVSARHLTQQAVADVVLKAFVSAAPACGAAGSQISFPVFRAEGVDDRPRRPRRGARRYIIADILGGGMGGSPAVDGLNAVDTHGGNCGLLSAEIMETMSPIRVLRSALVPGSGGEGQHRGGLAIERDYEFLAQTTTASAKLQQMSAATAPWGAAGGGAGATGFAMLQPDTSSQELIPARDQRLVFMRGDTIRVRGAGGGGYGDPTLRSDEDRKRDLDEGFV